MHKLKILKYTFLITIFIFCSGNLLGQIEQKIEISFNYGFIQSFENIAMDFGYGSFDEKYIRDGNLGGFELIYNLSSRPLKRV